MLVDLHYTFMIYSIHICMKDGRARAYHVALFMHPGREETTPHPILI
jgi:hypothetical protein